MKKRYKVVLNVEIEDPDEPYPAGGTFNHSTRLEGVVLQLCTSWQWNRGVEAKVTLDKVIDKGEINEVG